MRNGAVFALFLGGHLMLLGVAILFNPLAVVLVLVGAAIFAAPIVIAEDEEGSA